MTPANDLKNCTIFSRLSGEEYAVVEALTKRRSFRAGERIFSEGDLGEDMFVLVSGALAAHKKQSDGIQRWMFDISPGSFLGEMSIIANEPRSATISAKEDSELMVLQGIDFFRIIFEHPRIGIMMLTAIGEVQNTWLDQTAGHLKELVLWGENARHRAVTDELTGLYNRSFLEESIKNLFRTGALETRKLSLIMMDLDKVHEINDLYGSAGGDRVIIAVAEVLKSIGRPGDFAVRLSGDEFAVLLPDTGSSGAVRVAEKIREKVMSRPVAVPNGPGSAETVELSVRTSLGIAEAPGHANNGRDLMFAADNALRKAKELGRNRVELAG